MDPEFMEKMTNQNNSAYICIDLTDNAKYINSKYNIVTGAKLYSKGGTIVEPTFTEFTPADKNIVLADEKLFPKAVIEYAEVEYADASKHVTRCVTDETQEMSGAHVGNLGKFNVKVIGENDAELLIGGRVNFAGKEVEIVASPAIKKVYVKILFANSNSARKVSPSFKRKDITRTLEEKFNTEFSFDKDEEFYFDAFENVDLTMKGYALISQSVDHVKDKYKFDQFYASEEYLTAMDTLTDEGGYMERLYTQTADLKMLAESVKPESMKQFREDTLPETFVYAHIEFEKSFNSSKGLRSVWAHGPQFAAKIQAATPVFTKGHDYGGVVSGSNMYTMSFNGRVMNFVESERATDIDFNKKTYTDAADQTQQTNASMHIVGKPISMDEGKISQEYIQGYQFLDKNNQFYRSMDNPFSPSMMYMDHYGCASYQEVCGVIDIHNLR